MRRSLLPPVEALLAFESAARLGSFSRAATELSLTQSAISKQIRLLESRLGVELFKRVRQRIVLTDAGRLYRYDVERTLAQLTGATQQVMAFAGRDDVLNLAVLPTFTTHWLLPRLPGFLAAHESASFSFSVRMQRFDFAAEAFDAAIHYGHDDWPGGVAHRLFDETVIAVASPVFRDRYGIDTAQRLVDAPRLHQSTRPTAWRDWFDTMGVETDLAYRGARLDQFAMIAQAAVHGLGAALLPRLFIDSELASGALVPLFADTLHSVAGYHLVLPAERPVKPIVAAFRDWLLVQAADEPVSAAATARG